ncbi:hypothetical protein HaLaN_14403 [Haematococcus lacustris]|uniref:Uncharacterized protein n=1 Tax=Haematococcus lacustris TaxID=44745 RepID=A0A699Z838_HAELA|nr:hypothetical protein HaLaN_14403 [Haematococcus lacustris]
MACADGQITQTELRLPMLSKTVRYCESICMNITNPMLGPPGDLCKGVPFTSIHSHFAAISSYFLPLLTTRTIDSEQLRVMNAIENGAVVEEYLHEDYQPHVGTS